MDTRKERKKKERVRVERPKKVRVPKERKRTRPTCVFCLRSGAKRSCDTCGQPLHGPCRHLHKATQCQAVHA